MVSTFKLTVPQGGVEDQLIRFQGRLQDISLTGELLLASCERADSFIVAADLPGLVSLRRWQNWAHSNADLVVPAELLNICRHILIIGN